MLKFFLCFLCLLAHPLPEQVVWYTGSTSLSLPGIRAWHERFGEAALVPTGQLLLHDMAPLCGELTGIDTVNVSHLSGTADWFIALHYATHTTYHYDPAVEEAALSSPSFRRRRIAEIRLATPPHTIPPPFPIIWGSTCRSLPLAPESNSPGELKHHGPAYLGSSITHAYVPAEYCEAFGYELAVLAPTIRIFPLTTSTCDLCIEQLSEVDDMIECLRLSNV